MKQSKLILALPDLLKQADSSTMDDSALESYVKKLQIEFTIRMNIAADDDETHEDQAGDKTDPTANLPVLEKPSEEELEEWKKKCEEGERRVMHANMAHTKDKKHPAAEEEDGDNYPQKKSRTEDGRAIVVSQQPTPINRGSMIEELRRGACTPTNPRAGAATSGPDVDSPMEDAPLPKSLAPVPAIAPQGSLQRAVSISSSSSVYDEEMPDIDGPEGDLPTSPGTPAVQPLERFQPLQKWYARQEQREESSEVSEASTPSSLAQSRAGTQDLLHSAEEDEEEEYE
jgi:DNA mismatch repair protein MSH4